MSMPKLGKSMPFAAFPSVASIRPMSRRLSLNAASM
jgi:hypothetical protein